MHQHLRLKRSTEARESAMGSRSQGPSARSASDASRRDAARHPKRAASRREAESGRQRSGSIPCPGSGRNARVRRRTVPFQGQVTLVPTVRFSTELPRLRQPQVTPVPGSNQMDERAVSGTPIMPEVTVAPGDVVHLREQDYEHGCGHLRLRVIQVRLDLSLWYDGQWVWLEGIEIDPAGRAGRFRQELVRVAALHGPPAAIRPESSNTRRLDPDPTPERIRR